jgi:hypothetical protein
MRTTKKLLGTVAALGALWGMNGAWAGESVRTIDHCQELSVGERSSFVVVKDLHSSGQDCLVLTSSNIYIDLNGFAISGSGTGEGIVASSAIQGVTLRNGTVRGFAVGVSLGGSGNFVEDVRVENNTDTGMFLGSGSIASHVIVQGNWQDGAILSTACTFKDSSVRANGNSPTSKGLSAGPGSTVTGNTFLANTGIGLFGSTGGTVISNTVTDTLGTGVSVICPSNLQQNTATSNTSSNLTLAGSGCLSVNNVAP